MSASKDIVRGMAMSIWSHVDPTYEGQPAHPGARVPAAALRAADDLGHLVRSVNGGRSLLDLMGPDGRSRSSNSYHRGEFGWDIAKSALGRRPAGFSVDFKIPSFTARLEGDDLAWEGDGDAVAKVARHRNPNTRSLAEVREILAGRTEKCHPTCQGWEVFETDTERGDEIQVCDECNSYLPKSQRLMDDDVEQLPEAQLALAKHGEDVDAAEREEVEREVRVIAGGKVVPRGNPEIVQVGYDTTMFQPGGFQRVLMGLGIAARPGTKLPGEVGGWMWDRGNPTDGVRIVTSNDPITGLYYNPLRREAEKDFAGYMGIEGTPDLVKKAKKLIKDNADYIKDGPDRGLGYIGFGDPDPDDDRRGRRRSESARRNPAHVAPVPTYTKPHTDSVVRVDDLTIRVGDEVIVRPPKERGWRRSARVSRVVGGRIEVKDQDGKIHKVEAPWLWLYGGHGGRGDRSR